MDKDVVTLKRLRYKFNKLLDPLPITDEKTYNILKIPPVRKPKPKKMKIEEVTHDRDTALSRHTEFQREEAYKLKKQEEDLQAQERERVMVSQLEAELPTVLNSVSLEVFIVRSFAEGDSLGRDDYIFLDRKSLSRLKDREKEVNDLIMIAGMMYIFFIYLS